MNSSSHQKKQHKTLIKFLHTHNISSPSLFLILFILIPFLVFFSTRRLSESPLQNTDQESCPSGKVYVYDLPSKFNTALLSHNCPDSNPSKWLCGIFASNHGHGPPAADLLRIMPESLSASWYQTNQFALELIFHHRILNHKCRTTEPGSATAFYIPFYAGLAVGQHLWSNDTDIRDHQCRMLVKWIKTQKPWKRSGGSDHFIAIGRITWDFRRLTVADKKWGSSFLNMPEMRNVTRFIIEKDPGDPREVSVPYPTGFHPRTSHALYQWQSFARGHNRSSLFTFIGARRSWVSNDFRALLLDYCQNDEPISCRLVDCDAVHCSTNSTSVMDAFLGSEFCLQPMGDSHTRRSVFDCMLAGSVPVFFWNQTAYDQYDWFLPGEPESYSVFIDHEVVRNGSGVIKEVLMKYSKEEIRRKREKVIETIPRIVYSHGGLIDKGFKDAFDIAFDGVLERIREEKERTNLVDKM